MEASGEGGSSFLTWEKNAEISSEVSDLQKAVAVANVTGIAFVAESYPSSV